MFLQSVENISMDSDNELLIKAKTPKASANKRKKPKVTTSWTQKTTYGFIQAVETHSCIWKYSCTDYNDRAKRDKAWQSIAKKFPEHGVESCKAKWANLKTVFLSIKKKLRARSTHAAAYTQTNWPFWTAMQFYCRYDKSKVANTKKPSANKGMKPKVNSSWRSESTNDLIQAVESHPCIWKYSCTDYKDRSKRDKAWQNIAKKFPEHGVESCKAKWANLKTVFASVKKKMRTQSGQGAECAQPHWPFWPAMQFQCLHDQPKLTTSDSTIEVEENDSLATSVSTIKVEEESVASSMSPMSTLVVDEDSLASSMSTFEVEEDSRASISSSSEKQKSDPLQEVVFNSGADKWHGVGMYLALQLRDLAQRNKKAANKLHAELVKKAMEAILEEDQLNT